MLSPAFLSAAASLGPHSGPYSADDDVGPGRLDVLLTRGRRSGAPRALLEEVASGDRESEACLATWLKSRR